MRHCFEKRLGKTDRIHGWLEGDGKSIQAFSVAYDTCYAGIWHQLVRYATPQGRIEIVRRHRGRDQRHWLRLRPSADLSTAFLRARERVETFWPMYRMRFYQFVGANEQPN